MQQWFEIDYEVTFYWCFIAFCNIARKYLLVQSNNRNNRKSFEIHLKSPIKTPERRH